MRLAYCYSCHTLSKLDDYDGDYADDGEPLTDFLLEHWIDTHMHGMSPDRHPGGRVFPFVGKDFEVEGGRLDGRGVTLSHEVEQVRAELAKVGQEVYELKDDLRDEAMSCFRKHRRPEWPDRPCSDFEAKSKWLGRRERVEGQTFHTRASYLCRYCPYDVAVSIARRGFN